MQSPDGSQVWCPGQSFWSLIAEHVSESELPKIYTALGHSLVDMYTDVHTEAEMWHKMWQESQRGGKHGGGAGTLFPRSQDSPLADPPAVKELLRAEVKMLLQTLRERACRAGSYQDTCYSNRTNPEDTDDGSRPNSCCSVQSRAEDEIEAVRGKLNVTEIDQVVDRLRSLLIEQCEELTSLVKHVKANIKQKCQIGLHKSEPSLADLRDLRGAIQMDLELCPSLFTASSVLPAKKASRLSAAQSSESLLTLSPTSILRPQPPPLRSHPKPRPPAGPPLSKTSQSRTHSQHRITPAFNKSSKRPIYSTADTSTHAHGLLTSDHVMTKNNQCSFCPEQDIADLYCRTPDSSPNFEIKSERSSPIHKTHLSINCSIHSRSIECDLSPQRERKSSPAWRPRNINITPSPVPAPSGLCDAGCYSSKCTDQSLATQWKSVIQNRQQDSSSEGSLESAGAQTYPDSRRNTSESSAMSETGRAPAQKGRRKSNSEAARNLSGPFRKDVKQQQSPSSQCATDCSSHLSAEPSKRPSGKINEQFFSSSRKPHGGTTSQPKEPTEPQFLQRFHQPVPPTRVPT
ncbi:coiled-coil domain-containing protein 24 isoform X2 [Archocentrus centrarchus]|uniref:coiled-coil domain-containing protein 24 isoform X2 n=1 Tax=Archocentrus centrarchus TaxID=63155 RepID=UPI0011E9D9BD|nr:coiled-coil domain-containing protein 24 isoform X2 [Archocentrus centrarchus]